jgi:hypothetical protein
MPSPLILSFDYSYLYPDHPDGLLIPVALQHGQTFHNDTAASVCLFSREIGEILGFDIEQGLYKRLGTLAGTLDAFGHEVGIQTLDIALNGTVYFARDYHLPRNLLGRTGWLNKLRLGLIEYDRLIYLARYDRRNALSSVRSEL